MQPLAIAREGEYHDAALCPLASATAVRKAMREGGSVREAVPVEVWDLLESAPLSPPRLTIWGCIFCVRRIFHASWEREKGWKIV